MTSSNEKFVKLPQAIKALEKSVEALTEKNRKEESLLTKLRYIKNQTQDLRDTLAAGKLRFSYLIQRVLAQAKDKHREEIKTFIENIILTPEEKLERQKANSK